MDEKDRKPVIGLVLPGGGARAAYQVGVLKAIGEMLPHGAPSPFRVITGTSAGAINAVVLASHAVHFQLGVRRMHNVWANFTTDQVFRSDWSTVLRTSLHWLSAFVFGGLRTGNPDSLLDNEPLRELLSGHIRFDRIAEGIATGALDAVGVTASGYSSARAVTFFQGAQRLRPWLRPRREGRREQLGPGHLMASTAMPFIFPPEHIGEEHYGDGAIREAAPLSSAVHLGADRLLVIGARDEHTRSPAGEGLQMPSFGHIAGYMLDTIFLDGLYADLERLTRINQVVGQVPAGTLRKTPWAPLKRIDTHIIVPSVDIRSIAEKHAREFPRSVRMLLRGIGALNAGGRQLMSYLLFQQGFCRELIQLGYSDCIKRRRKLEPFLTGDPVHALEAPEHLLSALSGQKERAKTEE
ncbi:MAG: patatin-like phospholipase family protein [Gammaproteobacteria bacterium]|nr:patatin-like phospholipase family protein [Gammaproteobacteria bacterium]NNF62441.1 patatin-like phospholipase family protein [Gammaproteobacteria bacterium]NNM21388.1 patatin-like phospholipase family protein [Gammaproteobacteria bacterium]